MPRDAERDEEAAEEVPDHPAAGCGRDHEERDADPDER